MRDKEYCDFCQDGVLEPRAVREFYEYEGDAVMIDDVPVRACNKCGERYYKAAVAKELEEIAKRRHELKERMSVPLAHYGRAFT